MVDRKGKRSSSSVMLMVGTAKGAFIFNSNDGRRNWKVSGPHFEGDRVYYMSYDPRNKMVLAGSNSFQWGPSILRSFDAGKNWKRSKNQPKYPKGSDISIKNIWNIWRSLNKAKAFFTLLCIL